MPEPSQFVGNSLEELLVSIAEGVREAQIALNQAPLLDPLGRPLAAYQLPYLDFVIRVAVETRTDTGGRPVAVLSMARAQSSTATDVHSTISGRLVATPPGEGLPVPRVRLVAGGNIGGVAALSLTVTNSAGERLANQTVELNIDDADSRALSAARGVRNSQRLPGTRLREALLTTDAEGRAATALLIDNGQDTSSVVVVVASIGPFNSRAAIAMEVVG